MVRRSNHPTSNLGSGSAPGQRLRWLLTVVGLATLPLFFGFLCIPVLSEPPAGGGGTPASTFDPAVGVSLASTSAGIESDVTLTLDVPEGDVLPAGTFVEVPAGWGVAGDGGVIDGSLAGKISGHFTTDRTDNPTCGSGGADLDIDLIDATTDTSVTVSGGDEDGNGHPDVVDDDDGNGLPDGVDLYPDFLTTLAPGGHHARYFGFDVAAGVTDLFVNVLVDTDASNQITVIVGDPTRAALFGANEMCSPWSFALTLRGTSADNPNTTAIEGGEAVYTNPSSSGEYTFTAVLVSERDADNDGASNGQDNCPLDANATQIDGDGDGIGDACDPSAGDTNSGDHDSDGLPNEFDNCPTVANVDQADADLDDLGDVSVDCDPDASTADGAFHVLYCDDPVGIGVVDPGGATCSSTPPTPTPTPTPSPTATPTATQTPLATPTPEPTPTPCGPDGDGDGMPDCYEESYSCLDPLVADGQDDPDADVIDSLDEYLRGTDPCVNDTDGDGCADGEELGTDPALGGGRDPLNPYDFYDITDITGVLGAKDRGVSGFDLNLLLVWIGAAAGSSPYDDDANGNTITDGLELDFAGISGPATGPDGGISSFDLNQLLTEFGASCAAPP